MQKKESNLGIAIKIFGSGVIKNIATNLMAILTRTVFIYYLNKDLLGINSAVNSIISILSLTELGVGTSFIYILYGALNRNNYDEINSIMRYFKKIYTIIGSLIFIIGMILIPFLGDLINTPNSVKKYVLPCYIIYVVQTCVSYLFSAYKRCLLLADKKENIVNNIITIYSIATSCFQMLFIYVTHNYYAYLYCGLIAIIVQNIAISYIVDKKYQYLSIKQASSVNVNVKNKLRESITSIMVVKLGQAFYKASDNLVISKFLGVSILAMYDNYNLILYALQQVLSLLVTSFTAIIGHVAINESHEKLYDKYKKLQFITVFLFTLCSACYVNCIRPFIHWWIGSDYILSDKFAIIFALRFFVIGLNLTLIVYKDAMGLFKYGRFLSPLTGVMNVILSIIFVHKIGLTGIVLASLICDVCIYYLVHPKTVIKIGMGMSLKEYYKDYFIYWILMLLSIGTSKYICDMISIKFDLIQFFMNGIISFICVIVLYWIIKRNTEEWKYTNEFLGRLKIKKEGE